MNANRATLYFLKAFLRNPTKVGAIVPSAPGLARAMISDLTLNHGETVIELGPGTGAFTAYIRDILPSSHHYIGIEREGQFVDLLEARFPDMCFVNAGAEETSTLYQAAERGEVKVIISSLPFATLVAPVREAIVDNIERMMQPGTIFRTFQYVHAYPLPSAVRFRKMMDARFGGGHRSSPVLPNMPPAYVLTWKRNEKNAAPMEKSGVTLSR